MTAPEADTTEAKDEVVVAHCVAVTIEDDEVEEEAEEDALFSLSFLDSSATMAGWWRAQSACHCSHSAADEWKSDEHSERKDEHSYGLRAMLRGEAGVDGEGGAADGERL